jgi:hypothetical protein
MRQMGEFALQRISARRSGIETANLLQSRRELVREAVESPAPPLRIAADHRGFDEQTLPLPWCAKRSRNRRTLSIVLLRIERLLRRLVFLSTHSARQHVVRRAGPGRWRLVSSWQLTEREIFSDATRRQAFDRCRDQGEKGATRRMRAARSAIEEGWNAGAGERVLEQSVILMRRPHEDRHLVEHNAASCHAQDPPRDLDAFTSFTRCREEFERPIERPRLRRAIGKQMRPEQGEIVSARLVQPL